MKTSLKIFIRQQKKKKGPRTKTKEKKYSPPKEQIFGPLQKIFFHPLKFPPKKHHIAGAYTSFSSCFYCFSFSRQFQNF